jgi:hypothetical protein
MEVNHMISAPRSLLIVVLLGAYSLGTVQAQEKPIVGLIPKAHKPIAFDGKLNDWDGAFVTPVHVGHPDFANRGGQFLYLWDEKNLYIGLSCHDQHPAHVGTDNQLWDGDAVEFYLDVRRGDKLAACRLLEAGLAALDGYLAREVGVSGDSAKLRCDTHAVLRLLCASGMLQ